MNDFLSWCMHLVPLPFHDVISLHPPSFHRNNFSTLIITARTPESMRILLPLVHKDDNKAFCRYFLSQWTKQVLKHNSSQT